MKIMRYFKPFSLLLGLLAATTLVQAADMSGIIKAQVILGQVDQVVKKYQDVQDLLSRGEITLDVQEPRMDSEGKYLFPYSSDGQITAWADKAINAQAGSMVGEKAGEKATSALASKVPFGGLAGGLMKKKGKEIAAVTAIGGWDFIKENSSLSFDNLDDYSVYMHTQFEGGADYQKALAAAMAIYPELEKSHQRAIDKAYKDARKAAKKAKG